MKLKYFDLSGKIAIVTGVLGKLGPVWTRGLLEAGATVVGIDLPTTTISPAFSYLQQEYGKERLWLERGNIGDRTALIQIRDRTIANLGIPTIVVNNVGIDQPPGQITSYHLEDIPLDICRQILEVNILGAFQVSQVFAKTMMEAKQGSIINIGSLYASVSPDEKFYNHLDCDPPFLKPPAYGASKAALVNLTRYFATHWAKLGIRVNALSPGGVLGGQDEQFKQKFGDRVPLGRMAYEDDLIGPLIFLAADASAYITGIELKVDGGFTAW